MNCDVDMVKTIMRNLMSNAIKYSNEGGRIVISVRETPTHARISVRDFGTGIREEDIPKLLNPEIHYTTYGTKNEEGSGLGLQLVQDLTRRNGGELTIESAEGEGSTFTFTIAKEQPRSETVEDTSGGIAGRNAPIQTDAETGKAAKAEIYLNRSSAITTLWSLTTSEGM